MNFVNRAHAEGGSLWSASIARSLLKPGELKQLVHKEPTVHTRLWWGPLTEIHTGDIVTYFLAPTGFCLEGVQPPPVQVSGTIAGAIG